MGRSEYINSELRTKYVMIDPMLRALGWDTGNPSQVQLETRFPQATGIPDYTLFKGSIRQPVGIIEAKTLNPIIIPRFKMSIEWHNQGIVEAFKNLQQNALEENHITRDNLFDREIWVSLRETNEAQLEGYIREIGLTTGYGILTNGDDWWIYDIQKFSKSDKSPLRESIIRNTSILFDRDSNAASDLEIIRYENNWHGGNSHGGTS